jgi:PilZ domain-containing protein
LVSERNSQEKRASRRRAADVPVSFKVKEIRTTGITGNLSRGGVFVRTTRPPVVGSIVTVHLRPRIGAATIVLRGKVVHSRSGPATHLHSLPTGFGVRLSEAAEDYYDFLSQIRRRATDERNE